MKKQSVAEQTLNKQIKSFTVKAEALSDDMRQSQAKLSTVLSIIDQLEGEVTNLREARIADSKLRKVQEELHDINNVAENKLQ